MTDINPRAEAMTFEQAEALIRRDLPGYGILVRTHTHPAWFCNLTVPDFRATITRRGEPPPAGANHGYGPTATHALLNAYDTAMMSRPLQ